MNMALRQKFALAVVTTAVIAAVNLIAETPGARFIQVDTRVPATLDVTADGSRSEVRLLSSFSHVYIPTVAADQGNLNREWRRTVDEWINNYKRNRYPGNPLPFDWQLTDSLPPEAQSNTLIATAKRDPSRSSRAIVEFKNGSGDAIAVVDGSFSTSSRLLDVMRTLNELAYATSVREGSTTRWATGLAVSFPMVYMQPLEVDEYGLTVRVVDALRQSAPWTVVDAFSNDAWERGDLLRCQLSYSEGSTTTGLRCSGVSGFVLFVNGGSCRSCFPGFFYLSERTISPPRTIS